MVVKYLLLLICCHAVLVSAVKPTDYPVEETTDCGQNGNPLQNSELLDALFEISNQSQTVMSGDSCKAINDAYPAAPSGYYAIRTTNGTVVQSYCDMEGTNCGGEGGWTRVAYVNMTQPGTSCPQGLTERSFDGVRLCGRFSTIGCSSVFFETLSSYNQVCGRVAGYQYRSPDGFQTTRNIDQVYVDGISITYGSPRRHIWTYAAGLTENIVFINEMCPCAGGRAPPSFVGNDYYCESGLPGAPWNEQLYPNDILWDGQQCGGVEASCCNPPNLPWFLKTLNETTTDSVELRDCCDQTFPDEESPLFLIELYIR